MGSRKHNARTVPRTVRLHRTELWALVELEQELGKKGERDDEVRYRRLLRLGLVQCFPSACSLCGNGQWYSLTVKGRGVLARARRIVLAPQKVKP